MESNVSRKFFVFINHYKLSSLLQVALSCTIVGSLIIYLKDSPLLFEGKTKRKKTLSLHDIQIMFLNCKNTCMEYVSNHYQFLSVCVFVLVLLIIAKRMSIGFIIIRTACPFRRLCVALSMLEICYKHFRVLSL